MAQTPGESAAAPSPTPTPPAPSASLRFAVIGDFGNGEATQHAIADRMCRWRRRHSFDLVVTTGDNVYPNGAQRYFDTAFFGPYRCLLNAGVRFRSSLGNHDVFTADGRPELREPAFGMRGRNYVIRKGGVRFVIVDSNSLDRTWLRQNLVTEPGDRWTVVAFHFPVYSPGTIRGSTPGYRPGLPRMFRRRGVDLVLNGHDHIYTVTRPLRRIRYVVSGGGGGALYNCGTAWFSARCVERHHFLYVKAGAERILVRAVPAFGRPFHTFRTSGRD